MHLHFVYIATDSGSSLHVEIFFDIINETPN